MDLDEKLALLSDFAWWRSGPGYRMSPDEAVNAFLGSPGRFWRADELPRACSWQLVEVDGFGQWKRNLASSRRSEDEAREDGDKCGLPEWKP